MPTDYDVIVIGGGPAGSTAASLLSQWNRRVLLLERDHFPRQHIGESLLPGTYDVMKRLGVYEKVEQVGFPPKYGATYIWGKTRDPWTIRFVEVGDNLERIADKPHHAFQVDRAKFDKILLDHSRDSGVTVLEGCRVTGVTRDGQQTMHVSYLDQSRITRTATCRICVDASGQNSFLGRDLGLRKLNPLLKNVALYTRFQGAKSVVDFVPDLTPDDRGNIFVVGCDAGWFWYIPLADDLHSVGLVTDAAKSGAINRIGRKEFFLEAVEATPEIAYMLKEARMESDSIQTQSDWSYICSKVQGPGYVLAGDAAAFIDPILSTGVDLAMESGLKSALAINTSFNNPKLADQAMAWYEDEYQNIASDFRQMAEHWYHGHRSQDEWFAAARRLVDRDRNLSMRQAFIYLSGGYGTGVPAQVLPSLLPPRGRATGFIGGFPPSQLVVMYEQFDEVVSKRLQQSSTQRSKAKSKLPSRVKVTTDNLEESCPRLNSGVSFYRYMRQRDNELVPIIEIVQEVRGIQEQRLALYPAYWPLLERIDGERSVGDIVDELVHLPGYFVQGTVSRRKQWMNDMLQELYDKNILVPAKRQRATAPVQRRAREVSAKQPAESLTRPASKQRIGRNHPCPCGSGKKFKNCHGRVAVS